MVGLRRNYGIGDGGGGGSDEDDDDNDDNKDRDDGDDYDDDNSCKIPEICFTSHSKMAKKS